MKPINLYDEKRGYLSTVLVDMSNPQAIIRWKDRFFRIESMDSAIETVVVDATAKALHEKPAVA